MGMMVSDNIEQRKNNELMRLHESELEEKNREIEKIKQLLKASFQYCEIERQVAVESVFSQIKRMIIPYVEELEKCRMSSEARAFLGIMAEHLREMVSMSSTPALSQYNDLTPTEIRIADLIRHGKNTKDIAQLMGLSPHSVKWHRKNIREKLKLTNIKVNLNAYLNTESPQPQR